MKKLKLKDFDAVSNEMLLSQRGGYGTGSDDPICEGDLDPWGNPFSQDEVVVYGSSSGGYDGPSMGPSTGIKYRPSKCNTCTNLNAEDNSARGNLSAVGYLLADQSGKHQDDCGGKVKKSLRNTVRIEY